MKNNNKYEGLAYIYDDFYDKTKYRIENVRLFNHLSPLVEEGLILDIGCGTGMGYRVMGGIGNRIHNSIYIGQDISPKMIHIAKKKELLNAFFTHTNIRKVDYKFDSIISTFGSPSYLKGKEIDHTIKLCNNASFYFLMFYAPNKSSDIAREIYGDKTTYTIHKKWDKLKNQKRIKMFNCIVITNKKV